MVHSIHILKKHSRRKKENTVNNISNETTDITYIPTDVKRITREFYKQFYSNKFYTLDETRQIP